MNAIRLIIATLIAGQGLFLQAQDIDQAKMDRDLKIAEGIVSSLIKSESSEGRFYSASPKASYIPGFGVMININSSGSFYSSNLENSVNFLFNTDEGDFRIDVDELVNLEMEAEILARQAEEIERQSELIARENERVAREHEELLRQKEAQKEREARQKEIERRAKDIEEREKDMEERTRDLKERERELIDRRQHTSVIVTEGDDDPYTYRYSYGGNDEDDGKVRYEIRAPRASEPIDMKPVYRKVMLTFLSEYADLIGQLKDDEKVMLLVKNDPYGRGIMHLTPNSDAGQFSAETTRKNIADYKAGKISTSTFENAVNFVETKGAEKKAADLELFSSIFQRLYKTDLATTYYTSTPISYEKIKNFGVIYHMRMYSSTSMGRDRYRIITQNLSDLTKEERDLKVTEMYPQFLRELKQNILDYGKTIKSLENDESLLFQIRLTECSGCDIPREISVMVGNKTLMDYDAGTLRKEEAIAQIQIKDILK